MTDIVDRLRSPEVFISDGSMNSAVAHEAANTIEWLRADLHMWRSRSDMWYAENVKKQAACEQMGARIVALEAERDAARRKGIEAAIVACGAVSAETEGVWADGFTHGIVEAQANIRALLEDKR